MRRVETRSKSNNTKVIAESEKEGHDSKRAPRTDRDARESKNLNAASAYHDALGTVEPPCTTFPNTIKSTFNKLEQETMSKQSVYETEVQTQTEVTMKVGSLNVRSIRKLAKQKQLLEFFVNSDLDVLNIQETWMQRS